MDVGGFFVDCWWIVGEFGVDLGVNCCRFLVDCGWNLVDFVGGFCIPCEIYIDFSTQRDLNRPIDLHFGPERTKVPNFWSTHPKICVFFCFLQLKKFIQPNNESILVSSIAMSVRGHPLQSAHQIKKIHRVLF